MRPIKLLLLSAMLLFCVVVTAQNKKVTGRVTSSDDGGPLPGVSVKIKGATAGTVTDAGGNYTINAASTATLVFTYIGYDPKEAEVGNRTTINIQIKPHENSLQQVVVVGYGTQKRSDITGAVASVSSKQISELPVANLQQALQGRIAGIDVASNGSKPGSGVVVRIRGRRSFAAGNDPLYVVDGIPFSGDLGDISPNDIESMDVLKDASATAIYGSRGANGVVLVTTKRGKVSKPSVSYAGYAGFSTPLGSYDILQGDKFASYKREAYRAIGQYDPNDPGAIIDDPATFKTTTVFEPVELESMKTGRNTNYQDMILENGFQQQHYLGFLGGNDNTKYAASANYYDEKGVIDGLDFERFNLKLNLDQNIGKKIKIGLSTIATLGQRNGASINYLGQSLVNSPLTVPYDANGNLVFKNSNDALLSNPLSEVVPGANVDELNRTRIFASIFGEYQIIDGLAFHINFGPSYYSTRNGRFVGRYTNARNLGEPQAFTANTNNFSYTLENILTYKKQIKDHSIGATALYSIQNDRTENYSDAVEGVPVESQQFYNLGNATTITSVGSNLTEWTIESFMGRLNYGFKDKYLVTLTGRADGSSRFAPGNKWSFFPSFAVAWRLKEENFLKNKEFLNDLKLRGGYGRTGNTGISPYATQGALGRTVYAFGSASAFGFSPTAITNPDLKWETTSTINLGLDFSFFNYRLNGSVDLYRQNTTDLLMPRQLPITGGYSTVLQNVGATQNKGVELSLSSINFDTPGGFKWSTELNVTINREKIVSLYDGTADDIGNSWFIGQPLTVYYDFERIGVWQTSEAAEAAKYSAKVGEIKIKDQDGNGTIDATKDRVILGSDIPKWTGGITNRFSYKGFDFSAFIYVREGSMIRSNFHSDNGTYAGRYNVIAADYWTPENPSNYYPRPNKNQERPNYVSTLTYYDGSFLKVRNMQLGYSLPKKVIDKIKIQSLRVYASAQQPFILFSSYRDKYHGIDPEFAVGPSNGREQSTSISVDAPPTRTFIFGVNASF
ncbi:SusC/RagA family TonB-linked outer membrane protein [Pedobacter sp. HMF7647]|uniref:SusC/RagA family TonB-linked outer membrane protein n=1 Tax=Hufsiella arboris TaxID=2695275 RepID=A0A7K1YCG5_9SPHI|nr:TonB-dependent receptor [Hufsiella arboris]MXV52274.1 SusC/RagA family TonB-linked outer membrane protein [Hufsiella arboris]